MIIVNVWMRLARVESWLSELYQVIYMCVGEAKEATLLYTWESSACCNDVDSGGNDDDEETNREEKSVQERASEWARGKLETRLRNNARSITCLPVGVCVRHLE